ncbi:tetratricopeptide repeat protein [Okeanomitos corallinicola TIOX110]|uniref:Tetratricopeptide repeat protein n=1 Tax=Okeanomitos corallinicola TIOX110 TaxID=3133117 RepID=A0ABZ2UXK1_9CYAN
MINNQTNFETIEQQSYQTEILPSDKSILDHLSINPSDIKSIKPRWKRTQYRAIVNWLTKYQFYEDASNLDKVRGYVEAFYHLCEVENWDSASKVLLSPLEFLDGNHLSLQLDIWSYYQEEISLCQKLLYKLNSTVDIDCFVVMGDGYIDLGQYQKAFEAYQNGLKLSRQINNCNGEITNLLCLGLICHYQGQYNEAVKYYQQALKTNIKLEDLTSEYLFLKAKTLGNLGITYHNLDKYNESVQCNESSLALFRQLGDQRGEASALLGLGQDYYTLGDYEKGFDCTQQALDIAQEIGDRSNEAEALNILGMLYREMGDYEQAIDLHQQQIIIVREVGDLRGEGYAMGNLSVVYEKLEDYVQSGNYAQKHLAISQRLGDRRGEGAALHSLGIALLELSEFTDALKILQTALAIFKEVDSKSEEAQILQDLAIVYWELSDIDSALECCYKALDLITALELPSIKNCQELIEQIKNNEQQRD